MRRIVTGILAFTCSSLAFADYELYKGDAGDLTAGLEIQTALFSDINNHAGGKTKAHLTDFTWELGAKPYLNGSLALPKDSSLYGGFSYIYSSTLGHDPSGSTRDGISQYLQETDFTVLGTHHDFRYKNMTENLYLGWQSGKLLKDWAETVVDISGGRQNYKLGSGLLLYYGAENGGFRGGYWINQRTAFSNTLIGRINIKDIKLEGFHLETRPLNPADKRSYQGVNIEYHYSDINIFGLSYINTANKHYLHDEGSIISLGNAVVNNDTFDIRADFSPLENLSFSTEYVYQINTDRVTTFSSASKTRIHAAGGFGQIEYKFPDLPWRPILSYRYAMQDEGFDRMSHGFKSWGTWFQGEITGEFVLNNTNLITHQGKLMLSPTENFSLDLIYFHYEFVNPQAFALTYADYGNEVDFLTDWHINNYVSISTGIEAFIPNKAGKQYFEDGNKVWLQGMLAASFTF